MQLNISTDYAIRCMLFLTINGSSNSDDLAQFACVTREYVLKIMRALRKAGLVRSVRGAEGGYTLTREPEKISLMDIIEVMEDTVYINRCLEPDHYCSRNAAGSCPVNSIYTVLQNLVHGFLRQQTLASLTKAILEAQAEEAAG